MTDKIYKNPFNYTGSKNRILPLIKANLPQECNALIDLFGGSGEISVNLCDKYSCFYNEKNPYIYGMFRSISLLPINEILEIIDKNIEFYNLNKTNKEGYLKFREDFNTHIVPLLNECLLPEDRPSTRNFYIILYTLMCYSYNYMLQTNKKGEFNVPFGKNRSSFNLSLRQKLIEYNQRLHEYGILYFNQDYKYIVQHIFDEIHDLSKVLFFVDPPYANSIDVYSRNPTTKWTKQDDLELFDLLDKIHEAGGKFMMTNTIVCNGKVNEELQEWCKKYRTVEVTEQFYNCNHQRKNGKTREIILVNY